MYQYDEEEVIEEVRVHLLEELRALVQDAAVLEAFARVPRHAFVPYFYTRDILNMQEWRRVVGPEAFEAWVEQVYRDRLLVTAVDADGVPTCAVPQPSVLAQMLSALRLRPNACVLEVGTGSGYGTALLSCLVGPHRVASLEVDASMVHVARTRIERVLGQRVPIFQGDGRALPEQVQHVFDGLIVTGAYARIEPCWMRVLKPGGRIVVPWRPCVCAEGVIVEGVKVGTSVMGRVTASDGAFLDLHAGAGSSEGSGRGCKSSEPVLPVAHIPLPFFWLRDDLDVRWFLQMSLPVCLPTRGSTSDGDDPILLQQSEDGRIVYVWADGAVYGDVSLAQEIAAVVRQFERMGKPGRQACSFVADGTGNLIFFVQDHVFDRWSLVRHGSV